MPRQLASNTGPAPYDAAHGELDQSRANLKLRASEAKNLVQSWRLEPSAAVRMAATASYRALEAYWKAVQEGDEVQWPLPEQPFEVEELNEPLLELAVAMGRHAADLTPIEAAFRIGLVYTALLPTEYRARNGIFYTPPQITHRMLATCERSGVDWSVATVLDPACGGGAFLMPVAIRMIQALSHCEPQTIIQSVEERLIGFEMDPFGAWSTQVFVEAAALRTCKRAGRRLRTVVQRCDSLLQFAEARKFDLVIGNPPYGRVTLAAGLRQTYARSLFGHANLYSLFTDLSLRLTRPGGIMALVTPTSFLAGEYFKALRHLLGMQCTPLNLDFVSARRGVFDDVLQETVLATYAKGPRSDKTCTVHLLAPHDDVMKVELVGDFGLPSNSSEPWPLPRHAAKSPIIQVMPLHSWRLSDYGFDVATGPLVWNRHKSQLRTEGGPGTYPLIWSEAIGPDGRFAFRSEKRNHKPFLEVTSGQDWLITREPCILLQRTTAKEQSRRLIAAILPADFLEEWEAAVVENHLNMIRPVAADPAVTLEELTTLLNSEVIDDVFRCISGSVAVSAYELNALPLPCPSALKSELRATSDPREIETNLRRIYMKPSISSYGPSRSSERHDHSRAAG